MLWLVLFACRDGSIEKDIPDEAFVPILNFESLGEVDSAVLSATFLEGVGVVYATHNGLWLLDEEGATPLAVDGLGLPVGDIVFLETLNDDVLLAYVYGQGLYATRWGDSLNWVVADSGISSPLLSTLNPRATPFPMASTTDGHGLGWLATAGGVFTNTDPTSHSWTPVDMSSSGALNPLFSDIASNDSTIVAVSLLPLSILPTQYSGLLSGRVFLKAADDDEWEEISTDLPSNYTAAVAVSNDNDIFVGTLDQGVWHGVDDTWNSLSGGPTDVIDLEWHKGALSVGSASRGVWRYSEGEWTQIGTEPLSALSEDYALGTEGSVWQLAEGEGTLSEPHKGQVYIALSFHTNFYHSYRGDTPDDDGFGVDIDVIRNTLDWLDDHPYVHGNWDIDNAFTTDDWMVTYSPDILERIADRVANGQDEIRLMSWNNGAMAASTESEFAESIARAFESNTSHFGDVVSGVQPQECMFGPDHLRWYPENGVDWLTLFYAANGFTALRQDIELIGIEQYNPMTLRDPLTEASMTVVPVYHHADMLDHGGLSGWAKQLSQRSAEDQLLVVHFDADAESWESFALELQNAEALDFVEWTRISDYVDSHAPLGTVDFYGDVADGTGDGFQSWAEKDFNHLQFTQVVRARTNSELAHFLAPEDTTVQVMIQDALVPRLLALSTTNYGLAAPFLHPDRIASATEQAESAVVLSELALTEALEAWSVQPGRVQIINPRASSGPVLFDFEIHLSAGTWQPDWTLSLSDSSGSPLDHLTVLKESTSLHDVLRVQLVAPVEAESISEWEWTYSMGSPLVGQSPEAPTLSALLPPLLGCAGTEEDGVLGSTVTIVDGIRSQTQEVWTLSACGNNGQLFRQLERWNGLGGVVVRVDAEIPTVPDIEDLESVALSPLGCTNTIESLSWRSYSGLTRTRPARHPVETWNGQAADGWVGMHCGDESRVYVSHRTQQRSSMAFAPIRNRGDNSFMAPLGTLWGDGPWHFARQSGGHGIGEVTTSTVGSQFRPAAPDWSGQKIGYTLYVSDGSDTDVLDLFAHPPLVRVGMD